MTSNPTFKILRHDFNTKLFDEFQNMHYARDLWPIVYILSDGNVKEAYVGETTDTYARMSAHLKNNIKSKLTAVHFITSGTFNKSATLDIESNLIKYLSGDGEFKLINGNIGLANHNYYQKNEVYWDLFRSIWDGLRSEGIAKHPIEYIDNSDLFKYSPYKSLNQDQKRSLIAILRNLTSDKIKNTIVNGGAGTGKTILATFLFKLLNTKNDEFNYKEFGEEEDEIVDLVAILKNKFQDVKMALVVPMTSFRKTLEKVFKNIKGLNSNMVIGPADVAKAKFDILVVDESHRLRRRVNIVNYRSFDEGCTLLGLDKNTCNELDWITMQSQKAVLFYDEGQSIKPSDTRPEAFEKLKAQETTKIEYLTSQLRVKGGNDYVRYISKLLECRLKKDEEVFTSKGYEFVLFDSLADMVAEVKRRNDESGLSRLIAGYSWEWVSKVDRTKFDIIIDGINLRWNSTNEDWINSKESIHEVGCIHTTQGYDLNYAGVIFGNEISYDREKNEIVILKDNYHDKNGKNSISDPLELKTFIVNIYKTILQRAIRGTYIYACDKNFREYLSQHIESRKIERPLPNIFSHKTAGTENVIPLYDLEAAAGNFSELQIIGEGNDSVAWLELPPRFKNPSDFFACRVLGESMNRIIPNDSICLFRKYSGGSREGKIVLAESSSIQDPDFGSGYTVKEYHSKKHIAEGGWSHVSITLKPLSHDPAYQDIELNPEDLTTFKVLGIFEAIL